MNNLQVFRHTEFGEIGVLEIEGKVYFPASACAKKLGYTNPRKAVSDHCKGVTKRDTLTSGGLQSMSFIPEGDLYRLIVHSRLPAAERFESWVFDEVLPTIRRTGSYVPDILPLITQAVQAAVAQTVQALVPYLQGNGSAGPKPRQRRRYTCLADQLETPLRMELEEMIMNPLISYLEISEHFRDRYGVLISKSSIGRYAQRLFDAADAHQNARCLGRVCE